MKKAFSLVELSVVILIIGILIAGVTQSSRLISEFRLTSARTLTQSSPVNSIKNLVLWLECTAEKSFIEAETSDDGLISTWNDISPQSTSPISFVQNSSDARPTYKKEGMNNLPTLDFDGGDYFEIPYLSILNPQQFTLFAVFNNRSFGNYAAIISSRGNNSGIYGYTLYVHPTSPFGGLPESINLWLADGGFWVGDYISSPVELNTNYISSHVKDTVNLRSYNNASLVGTADTSNFVINTDNNLRIGAGSNESSAGFFLNGQIAEIIMFSSPLKSEDRLEVEKYLSKKWGIPLNL